MKFNLAWGVLLGIALVIGTQILTWMGQGTSNWFVIMMYFLVAVFIALALKNKKRSQNGELKFIQALLAILVIVVISSLIFQLYMFIYTRFIDPTWIDTTAETWLKSLTESGTTTEIAEKRITVFRNSYKTVPMFTTQILFYTIPQAILGSLVSLFFVLRKKKAQ